MFQGTFSLIIEALHTDANDDLSTGNLTRNAFNRSYAFIHHGAAMS